MPFTRLLTQGMVIAETYYREEDGGNKQYFAPADVRIFLDEKGRVSSATLIEDDKPITVGGMEKMSKSKNNGVDPEFLIERYGADTVRLFTMFTSPPEQSLEWSDSGVEGASRFLKRLWRQVHEHVSKGAVAPLKTGALDEAQKTLRFRLHQGIKEASDAMGKRHTFNTAIAANMKLLNELGKQEDDSEQGRALAQEILEAVTLMLAPIVPHITHVLWNALGHKDAVVTHAWPKVDEGALVRDTVELVVQVNGKVRGHVEVASNATKEDIEKTALACENVQRFTEAKTIRKIIVVPGRLVNVVAN